jgi:spore coat protein SA
MNNRVAVYLPPGEPFSSFRGGALATWTYKVYCQLNDQFQTTVVANGDPQSYSYPPVEACAANSISEKISGKIRQRRLMGLLDPIKLFLRQSYARRAGKLCQRLEAGVIHIHNDPEAVVPIRHANPAATLVLHMNNDHLIEGDSSLSAVDAVAAANWVVYCSKYLMDGALARVQGLDPKRCLIVPNGADLPSEPAWPGGNFKSENGPLILFVGRIVEQKGVHVLLSAMPQILAQFPHAKLRVVGGVHFGFNHIDEYSAKLRTQAMRFDNRVEFTGPVPHSEIARHLAEADIFVCPSLWNEPLGMVNLEAMGAGVPVVAFARGGIPEVVADAGVLVSEITSEALANALLNLLGNASQRRELSRKGRERLEKYYRWEVIASQWKAKLKDWMMVAPS